MGLERAGRDPAGASTSVYETDGYQAIMAWIAERVGVAYGESDEATKAHRVLADHGRGMTFLAADGVVAVERGPRLRDAPDRPPRRPAGAADRARVAVPGGLSDVVIEQMGEAYPELAEHEGRDPRRILAAEEERFSRRSRAG